MLKQFYTHRKSIIINSALVFLIVFASVIGSHAPQATVSAPTYSASQIIKFGEGTTIDVVNKSSRAAKIWVDSKALDAYMAEQRIDRVLLTVDVFERVTKNKNGQSVYQLDFVFGPSGAFFTPELEIRLEGAYANGQVWMFNETGEALETYAHGSTDKLYFLIPHFSRYSYDHYY